jgi:hypothetical protein
MCPTCSMVRPLVHVRAANERAPTAQLAQSHHQAQSSGEAHTVKGEAQAAHVQVAHARLVMTHGCRARKTGQSPRLLAACPHWHCSSCAAPPSLGTVLVSRAGHATAMALRAGGGGGGGGGGEGAGGIAARSHTRLSCVRERRQLRLRAAAPDETQTHTDRPVATVRTAGGHAWRTRLRHHPPAAKRASAIQCMWHLYRGGTCVRRRAGPCHWGR